MFTSSYIQISHTFTIIRLIAESRLKLADDTKLDLRNLIFRTKVVASSGLCLRIICNLLRLNMFLMISSIYSQFVSILKQGKEELRGFFSTVTFLTTPSVFSKSSRFIQNRKESYFIFIESLTSKSMEWLWVNFQFQHWLIPWLTLSLYTLKRTGYKIVHLTLSLNTRGSMLMVSLFYSPRQKSFELSKWLTC